MSQAFACDLHGNKKQVDVTEIRYIHPICEITQILIELNTPV